MLTGRVLHHQQQVVCIQRSDRGLELAHAQVTLRAEQGVDSVEQGEPPPGVFVPNVLGGWPNLFDEFEEEEVLPPPGVR